MLRAALALALFTVVARAAIGASPTGLPDTAMTPGAINPAVTQANIHETICVRGYTRTIRPPERYTEGLKRRQLARYGYADHAIWHYEEDHLLCHVSEVLRTMQYGTVPSSRAVCNRSGVA